MKLSSKMVTSLLNSSVPALIGAIFFFAIIGVFGLERAIGGLLAAILLKLTFVLRHPVEGETQ